MSRFSLIAILFLLCVASSYAAKVVDVETICKQSHNPSFCLNLFKSKPGGAKGDLVSLTQYTIDVLRTDITNAVNLITKLSANTTDPNAKAYYDQCMVDFDVNGGALAEVGVAQRNLKSGDYTGVHLRASFIITDVGDCFPEDFTDTSLIQKYVGDVTQIAEIIQILTNLLLN